MLKQFSRQYQRTAAVTLKDFADSLLKWGVLQTKQLICRLGIPDVVLLKHYELIAIQRWCFAEKSRANEFQERSLAAGKQCRRVKLEPPSAHCGKDCIYDLWQSQRFASAQIVSLSDGFWLG